MSSIDRSAIDRLKQKIDSASRSAVVFVAAFKVCCPHCREFQTSPAGASTWTPEEVLTAPTKGGSYHDCSHCGGEFSILIAQVQP